MQYEAVADTVDVNGWLVVKAFDGKDLHIRNIISDIKPGI